MNKKNNLRKNAVQKIQKKVSEDFCFQTLCSDIKLTQSAYDYYKEHLTELKDVISSDVILAFDTNLLLDLYKMSNAERCEFLKFMKNNAHRIIIPSQVEVEFMRHRLEKIEAFQNQLKNLKEQAKLYVTNLKKANKTASGQLKQLSQNSLVKNDMEDVLPLIEELRQYIDKNDTSDEFKRKLDELVEPISKTLDDNVEKLLSSSICESNDPVLQALCKTQILKSLSEEELSFIRDKYKLLLKDFNKHKVEGEYKKLPYCFPGCGDRKKINDGYDPTGDFIIYHELLAYMSREDKDVIFLTRDIAKSDWIMTDGNPFNHYIVDVYRNTQNMLYIFNAEKFIPLTFMPVIGNDEQEDEDDCIGIDEETMAMKYIEEHNDKIESEKDLDDNATDNTITRPRLPYLRDIDEGRFMYELSILESWAKNNGQGFVTVYWLIYQILRRKHFDFHTSKQMMQKLNEEGKIELYHVSGNTNLCIKTKH